ncbi:probable protein phosphatase 2C 55 isoform X2 [Mercurialis annua]|uniref:probable protein phosphatase 2C 55 isoform X2 n=1 Tax=Mercurialis annua TaxID=3986 RepID=UPI002160416C|nr:probable protein phosphatase 2C 55 isoform X2 [Mercurialis annua]
MRSFYISKDRESKPQGDDAHFINLEKQTIGLADGVGGWSRKGVDAGIYARELILNAEIAVREEPDDEVDPSRVLQKAWSATKSQGSATACILSLQNNSLKVVNMGDSGFMLIRKGEDIYKSPIQQHRFNYPYQLQNNNDPANSPKKAQVFDIAMKPGDVVIAGTDGLFDNLSEGRIEAAARSGIEKGLAPEDIAWTVAEYAYKTSMDRNARTPFSRASTKAGRNNPGGKQDDITVIVSYVIGS